MELLIKIVLGGLVVAVVTWLMKGKFDQKEKEAEEKVDRHRTRCPSCGNQALPLWKCELKKVSIWFQTNLDQKFDPDRADRRYQYTCGQCGYQWQSKRYIGREYCDCEPDTVS
jgi:ribosomal protein S27AE